MNVMKFELLEEKKIFDYNMDRIIAEYIIVSGTTPDLLACKVNDQLVNNFVLYGNMVATSTLYLQPMIRYEEN